MVNVASETVNHRQDLSFNPRYVRDVGGHALRIGKAFGFTDGIKPHSSFANSQHAPWISQCILLISLTVVCASFALGALISVLKGLDDLMRS